MLWLPKWMHEDTPPADEGVSRRTFLYLGAASAASLLLPTPTPAVPLASADAVFKAHYAPFFLPHFLPQRSLYARIQLSHHDLLASRDTPAGAFVRAMEQDTLRAAAEAKVAELWREGKRRSG